MNSLSKALLVVLNAGLLSVVLLLATGVSAAQDPGYQNINNARLQELMGQGVPVYDIRRKDEWSQTGVIDGSRLLTYVDRRGRLKKKFLPRFSAAIDKDQPVVILCRVGHRSDTLARHLVDKLGYTQVYNLRDGIVGGIYENKHVVNP